MTQALRIEGIRELKETLKTVSPAEGRRIARRTVTRVARQVRDSARERAPVQTGNLKRSVKSRRAQGAPDRAEAEVYADKSGGRTGSGYHWHLLEFGTVRMPAQPFINPTIEEYRPRIPTIYQQEWWPQYRKEMAKRARKQAQRQGRSR